MLTLFRDTVAPGSWTYLWNAAGGLDPDTWVLRAGGLTIPLQSFQLARRSVQYWDAAYHHGLRTPSLIAEGQYTLHQGDGPALAEIKVSEWPLGRGWEYHGETFHKRLPVEERALFQDCTIDLWRGGHCDHSATNCLYVRCRFVGISPPESGATALKILSPGRVGLIDCTFEDTARGPVIQSHHGPVSGVLMTGTVVRGCDGAENGCEGLAVEGTHPVTDSLFLHHRYSGAGAGIMFWNVPAAGNVIRDFTLDGGEGLWMVGEGIVSNTIRDGEIRGGCLSVPYGWNEFANVDVVSYRPTRGSRFGSAAQSLEPVRDSATGAVLELPRVRVWPTGASSAPTVGHSGCGS